MTVLELALNGIGVRSDSGVRVVLSVGRLRRRPPPAPKAISVMPRVLPGMFGRTKLEIRKDGTRS